MSGRSEIRARAWRWSIAVAATFTAVVVAWTSDPLFESEWHLKPRSVEPAGASVTTAWPTAGGLGVTVGIVDDGLQYIHPDLQGNYNAGLSYDFNEGDPDPSPGTLRHGTAVAGVVAAVGDNGIGVVGVSPLSLLAGIRLIAAPVSDADIAAAMAHQPNAVQILSNSWGPSDNGGVIGGPGPLSTAAIESGATTGRNGLGRIYVWAAGNGRENYDNCNFDGYANNRHTIAVGAVGDNAKYAFYSEPCSAVFVSAPSSGWARGITTTDLVGPVGYGPGDYTPHFGGTSAAAPVVSGVIALMLSANPALTRRDVHHILAQSSFRVDPTDPSWTDSAIPHSENYGFGLVDAAAAVQLASSWSPVPPEVATDGIGSTVEQPIPDASPAGVDSGITLDSTFASFSIERIEVDVQISHPRRGDLEIQLVSPSGVVSHLATPRPSDFGQGLSWRFGSVRHWAEPAAGTWTLRVIDGVAGNAGTWHTWSMKIYGTEQCTYKLTPSSASFPSAGGAGSATLAAGTDCAWTATSAAAWIHVQAPASGTGPATINYTIDSNLTATPRTGTIVVQQQQLTITQAAQAANSVTVLTPNGGERVFNQTPYSIIWSLSQATEVSAVHVYFAPDGITYSPVPGCTSLSGSATTCTWTNAGPLTSGGRIRVVATDKYGNTASDTSDATFAVVSGSASVTLDSPAGGSNWGVGSTQTVKWSHNLGPKSTMRIEISRDGGSWQVLQAAVQNTSGRAGSFSWTVTGPASAVTSIRVTWSSGPASGSNMSGFTIAPASITIKKPRAGLDWGIGTKQTIRWQHNLGTGSQVHLEASWNDGSQWTQIGSTPATASGIGSMTWTVQGPATSQARIRARWSRDAAVIHTTDAFTIAAPYVQVSNPDTASHTWVAGTTATIRWKHNLGSLERVRIDLSTSRGSTYDVVLFPETISDGKQNIAVSSSWCTATGRVRISWTRNTGVRDASNQTFTIRCGTN